MNTNALKLQETIVFLIIMAYQHVESGENDAFQSPRISLYNDQILDFLTYLAT